jgi:hypothetical protein
MRGLYAKALAPMLSLVHEAESFEPEVDQSRAKKLAKTFGLGQP